MTIGEEVLIHGYIDEIRKDIVIIRNEGGYFGTVPEEIRSSSEIPNTCGDAVSRQAVIDRINKQREGLEPEIYPQDKIGDRAYRICIDFVERIPSVTPQQIEEVEE